MAKFKFYIKDSERKPDPEPMRTNANLAIAVGMSAFLVALISLLAAFPKLSAEQSWWPWTCVAGLGLGVYAIFHVRRR